MRRTPLETYMRDHLAGSVGALELLGHLRDGVAPPESRDFVSGLREEIEADQRLVRALLEQFGANEGHVRHMGAWLTEKLARLKLRLDDPDDEGLRYLEVLESLCMGIHGKLCLWAALESVGDQITALAGVNFDELKSRASDQLARVEEHRLAAARAAFAGARNRMEEQWRA